MLPRKILNYTVLSEGETFIGESKSIDLPKLTRKTEEFRGGGMSGPVDVPLGMEKLEVTHKYGGFMLPLLRQFGITEVDGVGLRFRGAYQRGDGGPVSAVEIVMRGFHKEIDRGSAEAGADTEFSVQSALSYYAEYVDSEKVVEIDFLNMIEFIDGVDRLAAQRLALGV